MPRLSQNRSTSLFGSTNGTAIVLNDTASVPLGGTAHYPLAQLEAPACGIHGEPMSAALAVEITGFVACIAGP